MNRSRRRSRLFDRAALACLLVALPVVPGALHDGTILVVAAARAADVTLEGLAFGPDASAVKIARVEVAGTNLTPEEWKKLFTPSTGKDEALALLARLEATRIAIPEVVLLPPDSKDGPITLRGFVATDVARGKAGRIVIDGFDGAASDANGKTTFKAARLAVDDIDLTQVLAAVRAGDAGKATARFSRAAWDGFSATVPDKDTPATAPGGNLITLGLRSLTVEQVWLGDLPQKTAVAINNFTVVMPKASQAGAALAGAGYDRIDASLRLAASYDAARRTLMVDDLSITAADVGSLGLRGEFGGIDKDALAAGSDQAAAALPKATLASLDLRLVDLGGFDKALGFAAVAAGKTPDAQRAEWGALATLMLPAMLGGDPAGQKLGGAVSKFIAAPKSLTVTVKGKAGPVAFADLAGITDPAALLAKVTLDAFAEAGAAPKAAAPAAVAPAPAPAAAAPAPAPTVAAQAAAPAPNAAAPAAKLTGLAAWNSLVGNTISGKSGDGEELFEFYLANGKVKQSIDGETATGKWAVKGQKICFEFPDDEDETCYKLEIDGTTASFTADDGGVTKYEILKGNAKKL